MSTLRSHRIASRSRTFDDVARCERRRRRSFAVSAVIVFVLAATAALAIALWPTAHLDPVLDCIRGYHQSGNHCARD
jgi:hypothetical protein